MLGGFRQIARRSLYLCLLLQLGTERNGFTRVQPELFFNGLGRIIPWLSIALGVVKRTSNMLDLRNHLVPHTMMQICSASFVNLLVYP
jgi:hypothetical protein